MEPRVLEPAVTRVDTTPEAPPTDTPAPTTPTATPEPETIPYEVQPGDTVSTIAEKFGTDSQTIRELNLLATDDLRVGQVLRVPNVPGVTTPEGLPTPTPEPFQYVIQEGDTLYSVALKFDVSPNDIVEANVLRDPDNLVAGQVLLIPGYQPGADETGTAASTTGAETAANSAGETAPGTHTVKPGEYLSTIAAFYGVDVADLIAANNITNPDLLKPGTVLIIPGLSAADIAARNQVIHVVKPGEHLLAIARQYGVDVDAIIAANHITDPDLIRPGDKLIIPTD